MFGQLVCVVSWHGMRKQSVWNKHKTCLPSWRSYWRPRTEEGGAEAYSLIFGEAAHPGARPIAMDSRTKPWHMVTSKGESRAQRWQYQDKEEYWMDKLIPGRERGEKTGCLQPAAAVAKPELPSRRGAAKDELGCWCSRCEWSGM